MSADPRIAKLRAVIDQLNREYDEAAEPSLRADVSIAIDHAEDLIRMMQGDADAAERVRDRDRRRPGSPTPARWVRGGSAGLAAIESTPGYWAMTTWLRGRPLALHAICLLTTSYVAIGRRSIAA